MKTDYGWYGGGNGTNSSGFSGLPGGALYPNGTFLSAGKYGIWWSSSPNGDGSKSWLRNLNNLNENVGRYFDNPQYGFSVRCVRDAE